MQRDYSWARFPSQWVVDGRLSDFDTGTASLEALRLYLGMACWIPSDDWRDAPSPWFQMSYTEMQRSCGLNRSAILSGLNKLEELGLLSVQRHTGCSSRYQLVPSKLPVYSKIPMTLVQEEKLKAFSLKGSLVPQYGRSEAILDSLKLFILLLAFRNRVTNRSLASYETISTRTGILKKNVRRAVSVLINLGLIHVESTMSPNTGRQGANRYFVCDLARYRPLLTDATEARAV